MRTRRSTITLSIDESTLKIVRKEAEKAGMSANAKINDILVKYVLLYRHAEDDRSVIINGESFQYLVDNIPEKIFLDAFRKNKDLIPSIFSERHVTMTLGNLIKYAFEGLAVNGGIINEVSHYVDEEGRLNIVFRHSFGDKWSRVLSTEFSGVLGFLNYHTREEIMTRSFTLTILERNINLDAPMELGNSLYATIQHPIRLSEPVSCLKGITCLKSPSTLQAGLKPNFDSFCGNS